MAVPLACPPAAGPLSVALTLRSVAKLRVGGRARRLTLGAARFICSPGGTAVAKVRLSSGASQALRRSRRLRVEAVALARGRGGSGSTPAVLTLKVP